MFRLADGKRVLVEGANAGMLDIDFGKDGALVGIGHALLTCTYP